MLPEGFDWIFAQFDEYWDFVVELFNSTFFATLFSATAGAYYGAKAAQDTAEKAKRREQLTREIRDNNAAITVAASICVSMLNVKKQHIRRLNEEYFAERERFVEHMRKRQAGEAPRNQVFEFKADLQTLTVPPLPVEILQKAVFERISVVGRPLTLTTFVGQSVADFQMSLARRNSLVELFKQAGDVHPADYFGLRRGDVVNEEYLSAVRALYQQVDDCIFFNQLLVRDLIEHGNSVVAVYKKEIHQDAPRVSIHDFSEPAEEGLMPDETRYSDWFTKFKKHTPPPSRSKRALTWIKARSEIFRR